MPITVPIAASCAQSELLVQAQHYLTHREKSLPLGQDLEAAWVAFYDFYTRKIHKYAFRCGVAKEDIADCVQEVWSELLGRLPTFRLDPTCGKFDTWLFCIVHGKIADSHRSHKRRLLQDNSDTLDTVIDCHPSPAQSLEDEEMCALAWIRLRKRLSKCNLQILQMRLLDERSVADVADELGLSHEQVWYRYHRARREAEKIASSLVCGQWAPCSDDNRHVKKR